MDTRIINSASGLFGTRRSPPGELPPTSTELIRFPGRSENTLSLELAGDSPEARARLREFCEKKKREGALALASMMKKRSGS